MNNYPPVLITAALKVYAKHTKLTSQKEREVLYFNSLLRWIKETNLTQLVFCDNSNSLTDQFMIPLQNKAKELKKEIEFLQFEGSHHLIQEKGKGYGEGELVAYALEHSQFLTKANGFFKITGKLFVENFNAISKQMDFAQNYMRRDTARVEGTVAIDSRFFYMQKNFYQKHIQNLYKKVDDDNGLYVERLIYQKLLSLKVVNNFPKLPNITGISGSTGENYTQEKFITTFRRKLFFLLGQYKI